MDLTEYLHKGMRKALVQRAITCPRSGSVLDVRTAVFFNDRDGDPIAVLSQGGYVGLVENDLSLVNWMSEKRITVDRDTLDTRIWDTESSASSQHYIDTGRFLRVGEE